MRLKPGGNTMKYNSIQAELESSSCEQCGKLPDIDNQQGYYNNNLNKYICSEKCYDNYFSAERITL